MNQQVAPAEVAAPHSYITDNEIRDQLVSRARQFCDLTGQKLSAVSKAAVADPSFLSSVEKKNRNFTLTTYMRAQTWLDDNWPKPAPETPNQ